MPATVESDDLDAWLRLTETAGLGPATCRALLAAFGLPAAILAASRDELARVVPYKVADALRAPPDAAFEALVARTRAWAAEPDHHVLTLADAAYPRALLEIADPPPVLYAKGRVALLDAPSLAIVGSRNATAQGAVDARRFATALARAGHAVVSGLALGIDAAAHEGALDAADGASTIAVIGTGPDIVYPAAHRALAHRIAERGCLLGEFALGTPPAAHRFPRRNRLIAGLARGVLVVEAAAQSGSLITARLAAENGREVFAIPGSIHSPLSKGCHQLIRQGAKLVESVDDVLEELGVAARGLPATGKATTRDNLHADLLAQIGHGPVAVDVLVGRTSIAVERLLPMLLDLELAGRVERLPGARVQRLARPST